MSARSHGETTVECYTKCRQTGCPQHRIRLMSEGGGYWVEEWQDDAWRKSDLPLDIAWIHAVGRLLGYEDPLKSIIAALDEDGR